MIKDYFEEKEAADYCCCSVSTLRKRSEGIARDLWGKKVYRRSDLQNLIEREVKPWQPRRLNVEATHTSSRGEREILLPNLELPFGCAASPSETSRQRARRECARLKSLSSQAEYASTLA